MSERVHGTVTLIISFLSRLGCAGSIMRSSLAQTSRVPESYKLQLHCIKSKEKILKKKCIWNDIRVHVTCYLRQTLGSQLLITYFNVPDLRSLSSGYNLRQISFPPWLDTAFFALAKHTRPLLGNRFHIRLLPPLP